MKLIVGLGNPGKEYERTRHNVGFVIVDAVASMGFSTFNPPVGEVDFQLSNKFNAEVLKAKEIMLVKPQTFMNASGEAVSRVASYYKVLTPDIYVIHDDLDIPLGKFKLQFGKGPRDHRGIASIEQALGTKDFWRMRVGVEGRVGGQLEMPGEEYVLKPLLVGEREILEAVTGQVVERLKASIRLSAYAEKSVGIVSGDEARPDPSKLVRAKEDASAGFRRRNGRYPDRKVEGAS